MLSLDVLYYALAGGFLVFIGFVSFLLYEMGSFISDLRSLSRNLEKISLDVLALKNGLKFGFWSLVGRWLGRGRKGGGDEGR